MSLHSTPFKLETKKVKTSTILRNCQADDVKLSTNANANANAGQNGKNGTAELGYLGPAEIEKQEPNITERKNDKRGRWMGGLHRLFTLLCVASYSAPRQSDFVDEVGRGLTCKSYHWRRDLGLGNDVKGRRREVDGADVDEEARLKPNRDICPFVHAIHLYSSSQPS